VNETECFLDGYERLRVGLLAVAVCMCFIAVCAVTGIAFRLSSSPQIWTDEGTDCQYVRSVMGITPRLNSMGLQVGCNWHNPDVNFPPADLPPSPAEIAAAAEEEKTGNICVR